MIKTTFLVSVGGSLALLLLALSPATVAAPFVPADDAEVLEKLPLRASDPVARELRELRAAQLRRPADAALVTRLARRYFDLALAEGDPRYIGYAEAALRPLAPQMQTQTQTQTQASAEVWLLRALLRQYGHDFDGALKDLTAALQRDPALAEAHAWRAAIHMVQADYAKARSACAALQALQRPLMAAGCLAYVDAATGRLAPAYAALRQALEKSPQAPPELKLWMLTRLAEMAQRLQRPTEAETHFRAALALNLTDNFLLAAYADFLLAQGRAAEAMRLLQNWERSDTLLLRLALAEKAVAAPALATHVKTLAERFAAAALRGDKTHLQEEARFRLLLQNDASGALRLAVENYRTQREPRDAEMLLLAARATNNAEAARPALEWLSRSGFEDPRLTQLADQIQRGGVR